MKNSKTIYLDYAATTPVDAKVLKAMQSFFSMEFGNPSSLYKAGRGAKQALDGARKKIASIINGRPEEIIFTAGGSESVNLAIFGVVKNFKSQNTHVISTRIEHHCVLNSLEALKQQGYKTTLVNVDSDGLVDVNNLEKAIKKETVLISVMMVNNEVGTIEPIAQIAKMLKRVNAERAKKRLPKIIFHTDACQGAGYLDLNVQNLGVDLLTLNGSKIYGPKQTGILYVRAGTELSPIIYGGGQEKGLRSGTENVTGAVGLSVALELAQQAKEKEGKRLADLQSYLIKEIKKQIPNVLLNGVERSELKSKVNKYIENNRLCNNVNFVFESVEGEALMLYLDAYGFEVSTASACSTADPNQPSHVLIALGRTEAQAKSSIRFTFGKNTQLEDLKKLMKILPKLVSELRKVKNK